MGLTSKDEEGQAEEEQGACKGNSTAEGQSWGRLKSLLSSVCRYCLKAALGLLLCFPA